MVWWICGEVLLDYLGSHKGHLRENPRSLSSPKLVLWPRNYKKSPKITIFKRLRDFWCGEFVVRWYRTFREVARVVHAKTPGLYQVPSWSYGKETAKNHQKSPFLRGCVISGLVNLWWGIIGLSGKSQGSSTRKPQVSIKSQTGVMVNVR